MKIWIWFCFKFFRILGKYFKLPPGGRRWGLQRRHRPNFFSNVMSYGPTVQNFVTHVDGFLRFRPFLGCTLTIPQIDIIPNVTKTVDFTPNMQYRSFLCALLICSPQTIKRYVYCIFMSKCVTVRYCHIRSTVNKFRKYYVLANTH